MTAPDVAAPSLNGWLERWAASRSSVTALWCVEFELTYAQLEEMVGAYAASLAGCGVTRGDVVAVYGNSRPECLVAFLACCRIGAVFLGLGPKSTAAELAVIVDDAQPRVILSVPGAQATADEKLRAVVQQNHGVQLVVANNNNLATGRTRTFKDFLSAGLQGYPRDETLDGPSAIVYTSGTTGTPKGALLSQRTMIRSALLTLEHWYGGVAPLRTLAQSPINHVGWLVCHCVASLIAGGTLFFQERFDAGATLRMIEEKRLNVWVVFPAMVILAMETPEFTTCDLSSLERLALGTMPPPGALARFATRSAAVPCASYGLTEASGGAITATRDPSELVDVPDTIGAPVPGVQIRVVDVDGGDVPIGVPGEMLIHDTSVFLGYLNREEATAAALDRHGWLHTGDAVVKNADGTLRLVARMKEMFKSGGYNVYPAEVEAAIGIHPNVRAVTVVPVPDPLWEEVGVAFVVLQSGSSTRVDELENHARERLANYKVPKRFVVLDELPLLRNEKIDKRLLRDRAERLAAPDDGCVNHSGGAPLRKADG